MRVMTREDIYRLVAAKGLAGIGAEVGVCYGFNALEILTLTKLKMLYLVDPWRHIPGYHDLCNVPDDAQLQVMRHCELMLGRSPFAKGRFELLRMTSLEAAVLPKLWSPGKLDFVFLDADHCYESACADLAAWWPLIKPGGIMAGHDYLDGEVNDSSFGVKQAVTEFFGRCEREVHVTELPEQFPSWYVIRE